MEDYNIDIEEQKLIDWQRFDEEKSLGKVVEIKTHQTLIDELIIYLQTIQQFDKDSAQDGQVLHAYIIELTQIMSRANFIMADYKRRWRDEKLKAYLKLTVEFNDKPYFAVSLAKDYIDSQCSKTAYIYDLAERLSRTCTHTIDAIRTVISSLKSERVFASYGT